MKSYRVTDYYKSISPEGSVLRKQYMPDDKEEIVKEYENLDPLDENRHMVAPRLIHRYKDRVLLLTTGNCLLYCRHCFRRDFIDKSDAPLTDRELNMATNYIKNHPEVHEVILSGGDPLTLNLKRLGQILKAVNGIRPHLVIRIGTRVPIVSPDTITNEHIKLFSELGNIWINLQCNHPDELTNKVQELLIKINMAGVNLLNQSVLLKGVNDSVEVLTKLSHRLLECRVKPYYLFQGDLAKGTSHFRVPIKRGLEIMRLLREEVSGIALPTYAVDIPGGGGKIPLNSDYITGEDKDYYYLTNNQGFTGKYPKEED